jgi:predicted ribosomally synthesized peptide with nif11-like leader
MSTSDAEAFLQRLENDEEFARQMQEMSGDPVATHARAAEEGFEFTADEMVVALSNIYGVELTLEQLEQIAAGADGAADLIGSAAGRLQYGSAMLGAAAG